MAAHHPAPQFGADRRCLRSAESVCGGRVYSRACEYQAFSSRPVGVLSTSTSGAQRWRRHAVGRDLELEHCELSQSPRFAMDE